MQRFSRQQMRVFFRTLAFDLVFEKKRILPFSESILTTATWNGAAAARAVKPHDTTPHLAPPLLGVSAGW